MPETLDARDSNLLRGGRFAMLLSHRAVGVERLRYAAGETLIREGDRDEHLFLLETGEVRVQREGLPEPMHLRASAPGSEDLVWFGEMAPLLRTARTATVTAATPVTALRFGPDGVSLLFHCFPRVAEALFKTVVDRLRLTTERLAHVESLAGVRA